MAISGVGTGRMVINFIRSVCFLCSCVTLLKKIRIVHTEVIACLKEMASSCLLFSL